MNTTGLSPHPGESKCGFVDRRARQRVLRHLKHVRGGTISITSGAEHFRVGEPGELHAQLTVHRARFYRRAVLGGDVAIAMSYVDGDWDSDDLVTLFRLIARGSDAGTPLRWATLARIGQRLGHAWRANTRRGSRRNIRAHYDLGNDFFGLWLDDTRSYSSAIFASSATTLYEASLAKLDRVCQRLRLQRGDHLLEIGTGWGGLALHAARHYGCRVTTTTISQEQYEFARQRVAEAGLQDRVQVLLQDYRDLTGCFDKLVSIEMIEAVGHRYLDKFFGQCSKLLAPGGTMLLQAIVMPERRYDNYLASVDFIRHAIFPGGSLPSVAAMLESIGRTSSLRFVAAQDFALHYAETLRRWREAFCGNLAEVRLQGYPEQFIRLWDYYLCYCEAAFAERQIGLLQLEFEQPARNYPRSYLPKTMARDVTAAQASCPVGELP